MSTRKRPLAELPPNIQPTTPSRYAPSTPHAIRALQQRSGAKTRSARTQKVSKETVRPDSARGILRRLAKITAPVTRRVTRTPIVVSGKENERPQDEEDDDGEHISKKPRMTFDIEESIEESVDEEAPQYEEEEDSDLPAAPTPSVLPEDGEEGQGDGEVTNTFKSIDFTRKALLTSEKIDRRKSRVSTFLEEGAEVVEDDDPTMLTERGRRAISEEATGRLSRYSFGSLRMSDFGTELEIRRDSDQKSKGRISEARSLLGRDVASEPGILMDDDTQYLRQARRSSSAGSEEGGFVMPGIDEDTFQLEMPDDEEEGATPHQIKQVMVPPEVDQVSDEEDSVSAADQQAVGRELSIQPDRQLTELESAALTATTTRRRKRLKMTKHGTMVPSLPSSLIKHVATEVQVRNGRRRPKLGKDHMKALEQATEWFFEQVSEDLSAFADHGRRKKRIDSNDMLLLMRRQRLLKEGGELQRLAKDWLPKDILKTLDVPNKP